MLLLVQDGNIACSRFPSWLDYVVRDALVLMQEGKLANASFPPWWSDVIQDALVLVQEGCIYGGKLACQAKTHLEHHPTMGKS